MKSSVITRREQISSHRRIIIIKQALLSKYKEKNKNRSSFTPFGSANWISFSIA